MDNVEYFRLSVDFQQFVFEYIEQLSPYHFINVYKKATKVLTLKALFIIMVVSRSMRISVPFCPQKAGGNPF